MVELIQIGNSKGVRIPKALIEQAGLEGSKLELRVVRGGLLIRPVKQPREGWAEVIEAATARGEVTYDRDWLEADLEGELKTFPDV